MPVCAVLLLTVAPAQAQKMPALEPVAGTRVGDLARDFTLKDLDNQKHRLQDMRGKQVVHVVFWATWCVPCLQEVPVLRAIQEKYRDRGVQILAIVIDMNQTTAMVKATARDLQVNYPILWDGGGAVQDRYRVSVIPQNFLIDKDGVIRYAGTSLPPDYESLIESLLAQDGGGRAG